MEGEGYKNGQMESKGHSLLIVLYFAADEKLNAKWSSFIAAEKRNGK